MGSILSFDGNKNIKMTLPNIKEENISDLEKEIDKLEGDLPALKNFILPSGYSDASKCQIARTVCRRAERAVFELLEKEGGQEIWIKYLNRLSDYLFVLTRTLL